MKLRILENPFGVRFGLPIAVSSSASFVLFYFILFKRAPPWLPVDWGCPGRVPESEHCLGRVPEGTDVSHSVPGVSRAVPGRGQVPRVSVGLGQVSQTPFRPQHTCAKHGQGGKRRALDRDRTAQWRTPWDP